MIMKSIEFLFNRIIPKGFPSGSMILIVGEPGTGKTILTSAIANYELERGRRILFISLNEPKEDYMRTIERFGWRFDESRFRFIDLFAVGREAFDAQIRLIIEEFAMFNPDLVVIDSITALTSLLDHEFVRSFLHASLGSMIKKRGAIALLIAEKPIGKEEIGFGVEEFVVDGVIVLRFVKYGEHYRRVLEIPKMRRRRIEKPHYEYTITNNGIEFFEIPILESVEEAWTEKVTTGIPRLDEMMDGGVYRGSITVIAGNTGTGKTTFGIHFTYSNALRGKKSVFVTFEESVESILRAMRSYGMEFDGVRDNMIIVSLIPESESPINVFVKLKDIVEKENPIAMFIDSYNSLEGNMDENELSKMVRYLQLMIREKGIATMMSLNVDGRVKELPQTGLSTLADNIILLSYDFEDDEMVRKILILKSRASNHSKRIYRFEITPSGVEIHDR